MANLFEYNTVKSVIKLIIQIQLTSIPCVLIISKLWHDGHVLVSPQISVFDE